MTHHAPPHAFVVISRTGEDAYTVTYGSREDPAARYCCDGFRDIDEAMAWVDRLDKAWVNVVNRPRPLAPERASHEARPQRVKESLLRSRQSLPASSLVSVRRAGPRPADA